MPWWGAVVIAAGLTTAGFVFDIATGRSELTKAFAILYVVGCIAAVLAVRHSGVFTAVVQPPLILFIAVPTAYFLFHRSEINGLKDILINCGYPLIERFLLMFTTAVIVLLIGMARWYFGTAPGSGAKAPTSKKATAAAVAGGAGLFGAVKAKLSSLTEREPADADAADAKPLKHGIDRPATAPPPERVRRPAKRPAPTTSRHARPPVNDPLGAGDPPPRRRRPSHAQDLDEIVRNLDAEPLPPRRRKPPPREPGRRPPPEQRREPRQQRDPRDPRDPYDRPQRRPDPYDRYPAGDDLYERPPRNPGRPPAAAPGGPGSNGTHHPVSRVRYRGDGEPGARKGERPVEQNGDENGAHERPRARPVRDDRRWER